MNEYTERDFRARTRKYNVIRRLFLIFGLISIIASFIVFVSGIVALSAEIVNRVNAGASQAEAMTYMYTSSLYYLVVFFSSVLLTNGIVMLVLRSAVFGKLIAREKRKLANNYYSSSSKSEVKTEMHNESVGGGADDDTVDFSMFDRKDDSEN